ncbi:hypothetical protein V8E52_011646 [Russula decolorans]
MFESLRNTVAGRLSQVNDSPAVRFLFLFFPLCCKYSCCDCFILVHSYSFPCTGMVLCSPLFALSPLLVYCVALSCGGPCAIYTTELSCICFACIYAIFLYILSCRVALWCTY